MFFYAYISFIFDFSLFDDDFLLSTKIANIPLKVLPIHNIWIINLTILYKDLKVIQFCIKKLLHMWNNMLKQWKILLVINIDTYISDS